MVILAIESTCDETGAAVARGFGEPKAVEILSDVKASSAEVQAKYGGVIPEIAAREQAAAIIPVIEEAIDQAKIRVGEIEAIAVTEGPGLIGSLLIGVETAKALALAWKKPLIAVNHIAAHVFANWIQDITPGVSVPQLPAVALIVSGGHTDLMLLSSLTDWKWIGGTRDDAAGEAFDKAARAMGFPYPGGPLIAKASQEAVIALPAGLKLPRPMIHEDNLEMSFSGLKTALVEVMKSPAFAEATARSSREELIKALAREFNQAVADVLVKKTMKAVEQYQPKSVLLAGGVAANVMLREGLAKTVKEVRNEFFCPDLKYCTDNAAMIAACA
ncbi:MAG: tRNA (adenosine(37)-N6)-threonylcarbamoyltransferase complex transferase subunit TsaD, partial [Patescibacteria group bacterium]